MDYRYTKQEGTNDFLVTETRTGYTIKYGLKFEDAKSLSKHLNFGGGFGGWTPNFFLNKTPT